MKVFLITGMTSTKYGSLEKWILLYGRMLKERSQSLIVHYNEKPKSNRYIELLNAEGIILKYGKSSGGIWRKIWFYYKLIRNTRPDIVHSFFNSKSIYAAFLCGIPRVKNFWSNHLAMPHFKWYHHVTNRFLNSICTIFPVSNAVKDQMLAAGYTKDNVNTWYLGLPIEFMNDYNTEQVFDENLIVSIGHYRSVKGIDLLLKAFAIVKRKRPSTKLMQVGVDPDKNPEVLSQCRDLGILNAVQWRGIIDDGETEIQKCAVYVQPSRSEALPFTIMEASYMNKPIVAFRVGGVPEVIEHGVSGFMAEPENVKQLADFILKVLEAPKSEATYGKSGREIVKLKFMSRYHLSNMLTLYYK